MTLWIFGDSFAHHYPGLEGQWTKQVADKLKTDIKAFALVGSTLEYTSQKFNEQRHNIKSNDKVIIALTSHNRRWFFKDYPHHTAKPAPMTTIISPTFDYGPTGFNDIDDALNMHELHLKNQDINNSYLFNFLYNINNFARDVHTILLVSFFDVNYWTDTIKRELTNLHIPNGITLRPSIDEYTKEHLLGEADQIADVRVNHLCRRNHFVLAKKIIDNFEHGDSINLSAGFHKHFYNHSLLEDREFYEYELFKGTIFDTRMVR